ncbi:MAG: aldo/keto reductase [bacterium]|nr:aldo/keto reductase [bacterium]
MQIDRRTLIASLASMSACAALPFSIGRAATLPLITRSIPKTGEQLPVIGMGSSVTFNVGDDPELRDNRTDVLRSFFEAGGGLIDSSPMYGSSEEVIGYGLKRLGPQKKSFAATKVWTQGGAGPAQMENSRKLWNVDRFDLLQIHNLVSWQDHLETLLEMKAQNKLRYIGVTTSHGRRHRDLIEIMKTQPVDFVQFTYNLLNRRAERDLLPLARERKIAVIINRPFRRGALFDRFANHPLPSWASEFDCSNWAQFFLKFIISHSSVTCAIPATTRVDHMHENMGAARGRLPSPAQRKRMIQYVAEL